MAQGMLTNRYLTGISGDSRAASSNSPFLKDGKFTIFYSDKTIK
ncbi:hypothetical protein [Paenibacillus periandrae]